MKYSMKQLLEQVTDQVLSELDEYPSFDGISTSEEEDIIYDLLKEKYGTVDRQYTDDEKYPWKADFYIPSENMIIEYCQHFTHHFVEYDPNNPDHQAEVDNLKSKHNDFYDRTVDVWTRVDPLKKQTALENGYKFERFYCMEEFENWYYNKGEVIQPRDFDYYTSKANNTDYGLVTHNKDK